MKKLIVFDWNGTLLADTEACRFADNKVLKQFGGKTVGMKEYRDTVIIPSIKFYVHHGCSEEELRKKSQQRAELFHATYEARAAQCRTRRGARKLLQWIHLHAISAVILSNHTVQGIEAQLQRLGIAAFFTGVLANTILDSAMRTKNKEEKLREYLLQHQYLPKDVVIIGDSPEEIQIGKAMRITSVAITNGYYAEKRLREAKPDYLIQKLADIIGVLSKI